MKKYRFLTSVGLLALLALVLSPAPGRGASMTDYCITPPFIAQSIPPSVLIVLDNSLSMNGQAYAGSYDPTQFLSGNYYGYFDATKNYKYTNNGRWEETTDPFISGTVANPIASGNFLNWATMRRVDISKKLLIGGKASPRSPAGAVTVKLYGENSPAMWGFTKSFDNTLAPGLIYPFTGNYQYEMSGDQLSITPATAGTDTETLRPATNVTTPAAWTVSGAATAWDAVNDTGNGDADSTYIQNQSTNVNDQILFKYNTPYFPAIAGTISNVQVVVRAKKSASQTRRIQGVLRFKTAGADLDSIANYQNLSTGYSNYTFSWGSTNPATGLPWAWADLTGNAPGSLLGFGVKANTNPSAANYVRVTQVYLIITVSNPSGGPYNLIVDQGMVKATGIIDTLSDEVRFGLSYYANSNQGGRVDTYVDFGTPTSMVTSVQNMVPATYTPLGETLYEAIRYFRQEAPYYNNTPADYQTNQAIKDPFWYRYSAIDPSVADQYVPCAKAFILFLTDGESTQDQSFPASLQGYSAGYRFAGTPVGTTYALQGTDYMIDAALYGRAVDARPSAFATDCALSATWPSTCIPGYQSVTLYSVFMFGSGSTLLQDAAIDGGFLDLNGNNRPDCGTSPKECYKDTNSNGVIDATERDPLTYYEGDDGYALEASIKKAINDILQRASSGTAASVLASSEGRGANIVQAIFHPQKIFDNDTEASWAGQLYNLWYYIDPKLNYNSIREDTVQDKVESLTQDWQLRFRFDTAANKTVVDRYSDANANGIPDTYQDTVDFDNIRSLWDAGIQLFTRNLSTTPREIKTTLLNTTPVGFVNFSTANAATLQPYLQASSLQNAINIINYIHGVDIKVCSGTDTVCTSDAICGGVVGSCVSYRSRTVTKGGTTAVWKLGDIVTSTPKVQSPVNFNNYFTVYKDATYEAFLASSNFAHYGTAYAGANDGMLHAINFGKFESSWSGQNKRYEPARLTATVSTDFGKERWTFIPKNSLPYLKYLMDPNYCHLYYVDASPVIFDASINVTSGCSAADYWNCAKQTVYSSGTTLDMNQTSWRTILIGSMRLGGACKAPSATCSTTSPDGVCAPTSVVEGGSTVNVGYSSYFALDITDQENPQLLWEFSDPALGYSTPGPAFIRIAGRKTDPNNGAQTVADSSKNGRWFVVLGSGPTGPIDTGAKSFLAHSDQNLRLFVLDLKSGQLLRTIDTGVLNAFAGSFSGGKIDYDLDYQDDALYFGYTKKCTSATSNFCTNNLWNDGGVMRLVTKEDLAGTSVGSTGLDPANWQVSFVMPSSAAAAGIGPVSSSISNLVKRVSDKNPVEGWLYFGTGRYNFKLDDVTNQRTIFGVKEPCVSGAGFDASCTSSRTFCASPVHAGNGTLLGDMCGELLDVSTNVQLYPQYMFQTTYVDPSTHMTVAGLNAKGWYINLESPTNTALEADGTSYVTPTAERVITDPVAVPNGVVFFTTFAPSSDICAFGGQTFLWKLKYDTGSYVQLFGNALLQVSTGAIKELNMGTAFTDKVARIGKDAAGGNAGGTPEAGGRRTPPNLMTGVPPVGQGLSLAISPTPLDKVIHIQKK